MFEKQINFLTLQDKPFFVENVPERALDPNKTVSLR